MIVKKNFVKASVIALIEKSFAETSVASLLKKRSFAKTSEAVLLENGLWKHFNSDPIDEKKLSKTSKGALI